VPPSAASATPPAVACKNLRRVILGFKSPPLSGYRPGLFALLSQSTQVTPFCLVLRLKGVAVSGVAVSGLAIPRRG
jgi:hypothetical protein